MKTQPKHHPVLKKDLLALATGKKKRVEDLKPCCDLVEISRYECKICVAVADGIK